VRFPRVLDDQSIVAILDEPPLDPPSAEGGAWNKEC